MDVYGTSKIVKPHSAFLVRRLSVRFSARRTGHGTRRITHAIILYYYTVVVVFANEGVT